MAVSTTYIRYYGRRCSDWCLRGCWIIGEREEVKIDAVEFCNKVFYRKAVYMDLRSTYSGNIKWSLGGHMASKGDEV